MAVYYTAYLGKKTVDGKYEIIGPYVLNKEGKVELTSLWWRSQSFIRWKEWDTFNIPLDKLGEKAKERCVIEGFFDDDKEYSIGYWMSPEEIYEKGSCEPVRGYLPVEEAAALISNNYDQDFIDWSIGRPVSPEFLVGMSDAKRSEYSFVSYIDYSSTKYHLWELGRILNGYEEYSLLEEGEELGIIFSVG